MKLFAGCKTYSEAECRLRVFVETHVVNELLTIPREFVEEELPTFAAEIDQTVERMMAIIRRELPGRPE